MTCDQAMTEICDPDLEEHMEGWLFVPTPSSGRKGRHSIGPKLGWRDLVLRNKESTKLVKEASTGAVGGGQNLWMTSKRRDKGGFLSNKHSSTLHTI